MVVPVSSEQDWLPTLTDLPHFIPGPAPLLFLAPHPDDETLAAGGLLAAQREHNLPITLVAVTDGENAYQDQRDLGKIRIQEQTAAATRLGIPEAHIVRLHLTDSSVKSEQEILLERLLPITTQQTHILAPWPNDFHPDHEACGAAALDLAQRTGARLTFYFFWTWHRGTPALLDNLKLQVFPLTPNQQQTKAEALAFHASQLAHPSGDPILHDIHLWPASLPFEIYLPA